MANLNERSAKLKEELKIRLEMPKIPTPTAPPISRSFINTYSNRCWYDVLGVSIIDGPKAINSKARQMLMSYYLDK